MNVAVWQKLDQMARAITPFGLSLFLVILSVVPTHIPGYAQITPILALVSIYHWAIYRPNLLPLFAVFLLGLLQDLLMGTPVGLYILVFLTVYGIALSQRRFFAGKSFTVCWFGFAVISLVASVESWLLASAWNLALIDINAVTFQYLLSLGIFPIVAWIFLRCQQAFLQQD
jgi:rod shape-determining protein MreD